MWKEVTQMDTNLEYRRWMTQMNSKHLRSLFLTHSDLIFFPPSEFFSPPSGLAHHGSRLQSDGSRALMWRAARGGCCGQSGQACLRRAGGVGQTVPKSSVLVLNGGRSLGDSSLGLLQQGTWLRAGFLPLQASVLIILPFLCCGCALILIRQWEEDGEQWHKYDCQLQEFKVNKADAITIKAFKAA